MEIELLDSSTLEIKDQNDGLYTIVGSSTLFHEAVNVFSQNINVLSLSDVVSGHVFDDLNNRIWIRALGTNDKDAVEGEDMIRIYLLEEELDLFTRWLDWNKGLSNKNYKPLFIFPRGEYIETSVLEAYTEIYNHLLINGNNVVVNLNDMRSCIIRTNGERIKAELHKTMDFIESKRKHPLPRIETNTPVVTVNESAKAYIFCEYLDAGLNPWSKCLIADMVDSELRYHEVRRSQIKPLSNTVIDDINALGQAVYSRRYPELR